MYLMQLWLTELSHCSTKYSPYYLVFGRNMRLPIEGDWRPKTSEDRPEEANYEEYVKTLAMWLYEAHQIAGQHSKQVIKMRNNITIGIQNWNNFKRVTWFIYMILSINVVKLKSLHISIKVHLKLSQKPPL